MLEQPDELFGAALPDRSGALLHLGERGGKGDESFAPFPLDRMLPVHRPVR
jgi:hypothetical protein